jgi:hypothetical protein
VERVSEPQRTFPKVSARLAPFSVADRARGIGRPIREQGRLVPDAGPILLICRHGSSPKTISSALSLAKVIHWCWFVNVAMGV